MQPTIRRDRWVFHLAWRILFLILMSITSQPAFATQTIIQVTTADELKEALRDVQPGQTIQLADGTYTGNFAATQSGTADQPIYLQGSQAAILENNSTTNGYGFYINNANHWTLTGFTIQNAAKGVMLDHADHNVLDHLLIQNIGLEGVHFRSCSAHNILQNSIIRETGVITPGKGEGVYIGSDHESWNIYGCGDVLEKSDQSHDNQIRDNIFGPNVRAEAIDAKEGTKDGKIIGNYFDATGLSGDNYANSWVDIKGNQYEVSKNEGHRGDTIHLQHGFETHHKADAAGWGRNNFFQANLAYLDADGYGFHIDTQDPDHANVVYADNQVFGAGQGLTNIGVTELPPATPTGTPTATLTATLTVTPTATSTEQPIVPTIVPTPTSQFILPTFIWLPLIMTAAYAGE